MNFVRRNWIKLALGTGVAICALALYSESKAADLGSGCCADLEERIAELEATTARKGTRKVSLTVYGQVNKALLYYDVDDLNFSDTSVIENSASETFVGFAGKAQINKDWAAGYVLELGQGKTGVQLNLLPTHVGIGTDNDFYTRQSYAYLSGPMGRVSVGLQSMATDDLTAASIVNGTTASSKRLTFQPIGNVMVSVLGISIVDVELEPFNGHKADSVRYDSPVFAGFSASAAWESNSESWDAALRYGGELAGFAVIAAVGYEEDKSDDLLSFLFDVETKTITANAGVKHMASGIFAQGSWARYEIVPANIETDAWHVQAGWDGKLFDVGQTTIWAGYFEWSDLDTSVIELGLNQNLAGGADLYLVGKQYDLGGTDAQSVLGGMRLRF